MNAKDVIDKIRKEVRNLFKKQLLESGAFESLKVSIDEIEAEYIESLDQPDPINEPVLEQAEA